MEKVVLDRRSVALVGGLAGLAGWALLSVAWAPAAAWPVLEAERGVLYVIAAGALLLVVTPAHIVSLFAGIAAGIGLVATYALATRLFPGHVGGPYDPGAGYQLSAPIGYWNALGLLLAMGVLLATGLALRGGALLRIPAAAVLVPLSAALYFTFSRGAVLALAVGIVVLVALRPGDALGFVVVAAAPASAVILCSRPTALTRAGEALETAQEQGQRLAWQLAVVTAAAALLAWWQPRLTARVSISRRLARSLVLAGAAVLAALALGAVIRAGGPVAIVDRGLEAFRREPPPNSGELDRRLLSVSSHGRADYWRVAFRMIERDPLLGEGAGGFERRWMQERAAEHNARDAHNLYLETLAELGSPGLALLLVALVAPLSAVPRARRSALGPAAAAAYVAFLVHAAVDWDWEVPVLVLPALACGVALIVEARTGAPSSLSPLRRAAIVGAVACAIGVALVAHVGNRAVAEAAAALERGDTIRAADAARRARAWAPWSHQPWQLLGEAQLAARDDAAARRSLRRALDFAPEEWRLWFDLAIVSEGAQQRVAVTRARELNPLSSEIRDLGYR